MTVPSARRLIALRELGVADAQLLSTGYTIDASSLLAHRLPDQLHVFVAPEG